MKPMQQGAREGALTTKGYSLQEQTAPMYQLTGESSAHSTNPSHSSTTSSSSTSNSTTLTPIQQRQSKLKIQWATDSDTSASSMTDIPQPRPNNKLKIKWDSSSESSTASKSIPTTIKIPTKHQLPISTPRPPSQQMQSSPFQTALQTFFSTPVQSQTQPHPPHHPPSPDSPHYLSPTTAPPQPPHKSSSLPRQWNLRRGARHQRTKNSFFTHPPNSSTREIISPPTAQSKVSQPVPSQHATVLNTAAATTVPNTRSTHTNPYVKKRDQILPSLPVPLLHLQNQSPDTKSLSKRISHSEKSNDDSHSITSMSTTTLPPRTYNLRRRTNNHVENIPQPSDQNSVASSIQTSLSDGEVRTIIGLITQDLNAITTLTENLTDNDSQLTSEIQSLRTQNSSIRDMLELLSKQSSSNSSMDITPTHNTSLQSSQPATNNDVDNSLASSVSDHTPCPFQSPTDTSSNTSKQQDTNANSVNINNLDSLFMNEISNTLVDRLGPKCPDDFRIIFQNPNGIKIYQDKDPEYLPSIESLKTNCVDMVCLAETNVPWHKNDFLYHVSKQNQITWSNLPVKTVAASCRRVTHTSPNYQPGGCMSIVTNTMTTKIKNATSDYLGRWTRVNFFATKGTVAVYTVYRPNKSSLGTAGGDTVWMQQQQIIEKEKDKENPRYQLIRDIRSSQEQQHTEIIILGDFNEDPRDGEENGLATLMTACNLLNVCQQRYDTLPSTRNNERSIDHILASPGIFSHIRAAGVVPKDIGFSMSDHQALFLDLHPTVLDTQNIPLQPPSTRKLRIHNAPMVEWYILQVLEKAEDQNISNRIRQLNENIKLFGFTEDSRIELEKIDSQMTHIMLQSEQSLSPDSTPFPFSVQLLEQINSVRLIKRLRNMKRDGKIHEMQELVSRNPGLDYLEPKSVHDITAILTDTRQELKRMQEEADEIREVHHDKVYEKAAELYHKDKMTIIKEMKEREKMCRVYQKINFVLTPTRF